MRFGHHQGELLVTAIVLMVLATIVGLLETRHAPAVSIALFGAIAAGIIGFFVGVADGPKGVPEDVMTWASGGFVLAGVIGLAAVRGRPPSGILWRTAIGCVAAATFAGLLILLVVRRERPLYRMGNYCSYEGVDLLGGWSSTVVVLVLFDRAVLSGLFLVPARHPKSREAIRLGDDELSRL